MFGQESNEWFNVNSRSRFCLTMERDWLPPQIAIHDDHSKNVFFAHWWLVNSSSVYMIKEANTNQISMYLRWSASNPDYSLFLVLSQRNQSTPFGFANRQNVPYPKCQSASNIKICCFQEDGIFVKGWQGVKDCWLEKGLLKSTP